MTARFVLDTDICILSRAGRSGRRVQRVLSLPPGDAVMSVVTYGELRVGAEKSSARLDRLHALDVLTKLVPVQPLPVEAAVHYAEIRATLERRGEIIGANDLWIAAHARAARLTLVTGNEREFRRVPGLAVENWAS